METGLGLIGGGDGDGDGDGGGGGVSSGGSTNGSVSTVTKAEVVEQDYCMGLLSEVSSYNHSDSVEAELELGLGLSLGGVIKAKPFSRREHGRILTAKDLGSIGSTSSSSTSGRGSNASASTVAGTKRAADSVQEMGGSNGVSQVVGWPPVRAYRINSLVNQVKVPTEGDTIVSENGKTISNTKKKSNLISSNNTSNVKEKGRVGASLFVKVNMDGIAIGRKVDLNAHSCYETLAQTLEDMFHRPTTTINSIRSSGEEHGVEATRPAKPLDGLSDFVLTYEDKEGDWMLVGDVPWGMFLSTVKRLRIMRTSEVNGLAPRIDNSCERQRSKPI